jgi:NAD(P)-dependent dehydrogenase (short-subunit alcohol dehydrogenase family)
MIIVTGGTHGIGRATAHCLSAAGAQVLIAGRDAETGDRLTREMGGVSYIQADIGEDSGCQAIVDRALALGNGRIAGLVNNAGMGRRHDFGQTTVADWDEMMRINARSAYLMTRLALDGLIAGQGAVVNVASVAGRAGEENLALYTASKAALIALTQSLALELGDRVRFNAVCPGQIGTRMMGAVLSDDTRRRTLELRIPAGRIGAPEEVGEMIAWLLSDAARYVNGAVIPVDGGETAGLRNPRTLD